MSNKHKIEFRIGYAAHRGIRGAAGHTRYLIGLPAFLTYVQDGTGYWALSVVSQLEQDSD